MRLFSMVAVVFCATAAARCATGTELVQQLPKSEPIPVLAWRGPPPEESTPARFQEAVDAGFTHSYSRFPDNDSMKKALDAAESAGLKLFLCTPELEAEPEATVRQFKNHPALGGYFIDDEPSAKDYPRLGKWIRRIQSVDATHPCYVNLFPDYASLKQLGCDSYAEYVDRFIEQVPTPMLSYDYYPVTNDGLRPGWYQNMELIAKAAKKANRPLWAFSLSVPHGEYPMPTLEQVRLQIFSDLAYGTQVIQYFSYWTLGAGFGFKFHDAPIDESGKRTLVYDIVKQVNTEVQALAPVFRGATVESVGHTGDSIPVGTQRYTPTTPVRKLETTGTGAVVSHLVNGDRRYLVVVNRDYQQPTTVSIELDPATPVARVTSQGELQPSESHKVATELSPGNLLILTWQAEAND
jgi:hypothetical protein